MNRVTDRTADRHDFEIDIAPQDIDFMGHVNNANYLNWVQEAVLSHWRKVAPPSAVAAHLWVALKHEITYRKPAFLDDRLIATSIAERVQGASAFFETVIRRGEEVVAEVKSRWCCLDAETLRPARIAEEIAALFLARSEKA